MSLKKLGTSLTATGTTKLYDLGETFERDHPTADYGKQVWVYVYNDEASSAFAAGNIISRDAATVTYDGILAAVDTPANRILGVAQHAIAAGSYGWILRSGVGLVIAGTETLDVNEGIYVSAATAGAGMEEGVAVTASNTAITNAHLAGPIGTALANAAAAATALAIIDCRG